MQISPRIKYAPFPPSFSIRRGLYLYLCAITDGGVLLCLDYRETAAKFQKEWHIQAPHRHFDFAPHVKNYALVSVLNKGLVYEDVERQYAESQVRSRSQFGAAQVLHFRGHPTGLDELGCVWCARGTDVSRLGAA